MGRLVGFWHDPLGNILPCCVQYYWAMSLMIYYNQGSTKAVSDYPGACRFSCWASRFRRSLPRRASVVEKFHGSFDCWVNFGLVQNSFRRGTEVQVTQRAAEILSCVESWLTRLIKCFALQSVVSCLWHIKLNQIIVGCGDGNIRVFFDPERSTKWVDVYNVTLCRVASFLYSFALTKDWRLTLTYCSLHCIYCRQQHALHIHVHAVQSTIVYRARHYGQYDDQHSMNSGD